MPTISDITTTARSYLNHIDALLDTGPDWNYLTPAGNTILYTFSVTAGLEQEFSGQSAFSIAQQIGVRTALNYLGALTGINFVATADGAAAQVHLSNMDIADPATTGLCSWNSSIQYISGSDTLVGYSASAYVYLDNNEWAGRNSDLSQGGDGYETLLHELGHAMGLKHPFFGAINLPAATDNTANTLMSYKNVGGPHATYGQYDIAALNWIYGGDGLRGALGLNSATGARLITGSSGADIVVNSSFNILLENDKGNDMIKGGDGIDTVVFRGARGDYAFTRLANGDLQASSLNGGSGTLGSIEVLQFSNGTFQSAQVIDSAAPAAPSMSVTKNGNGYVVGNTAFVVGIAEAGASVKVYFGNTQVGAASADATGFWSLTTLGFLDGINYQLYARATDGAGNTSVASATVNFNVDAHAPLAPTGGVTLAVGSNQPEFNGTGEAGSTIELVNADTLVGQATVAPNGAWNIKTSPLSNGDYKVTVISSDLADNATVAQGNLTFTVASTNNLVGSAAGERLTPTAGNNAVEGGAGTDTAVYAGARANYMVAHDVNGFTVTDNVGANGLDSLINVERIQFGDTWMALDLNGVAGQAFRLYQAVLGRAPEAAGLGFWMHFMDGGMTVNQAAAQFMPSDEYIAKYQGTDDRAFISKLYNNVLHREGEASGMDFWLKAIQVDHHSRAEVLAWFSESPENQVRVIGSIQNGIEFTPWTA